MDDSDVRATILRKPFSAATLALAALTTLGVAVAIALPTVAPAHTARGGDDDTAKRLSQAKTLLVGPKEGQVNEGAKICVEVGNPDAMRLLIEVLDRTQPHFRDIVYEAMGKFTDPYARKLVALKLRASNTNVRVREWCAQVLGTYDVPDYNAQLLGAASSADERVRAAVAHSLGLIKDKDNLSRALSMTKDADPLVRSDAVEAVARIDAGLGKPVVWAALKDQDAGTRCAVLGVVPSIWPELNEETAATALADRDWRPRIQAVDNVGTVATKTAVDLLVRATNDARPAVANRAGEYLTKHTTLRFTLAKQWEEWWAAHREAFVFGEQKGAAVAPQEQRTVAGFAGLEVTSDHVAFIMDKSLDMKFPLKDGKTKEAAAREALAATFGALPDGVQFDVVTYGAQIQHFAKEPTPTDGNSRAAALKFLDGIACEGRKDIWAVLEEVVSDATIDTIYLLSSGEPEVGLYVHWNRVTEHLAILNRHHKVVVHCVSYTESAWFRSQLQKIAEVTGGRFIARE